MRKAPAISCPVPPKSRSAPLKDHTETPKANLLPQAELLVCVTCKSSLPADPTDLDETRPGARLFAALTAEPTPPGLRIRAVECLSNCTRGCTVALRGGPDRWSYVYGNIDAATHAESVLDGARRYQAVADGLVPWRERSDHFRKNCIARIPPLTLPEDAENV
jgi:predicted metal-binding protein